LIPRQQPTPFVQTVSGQAPPNNCSLEAIDVLDMAVEVDHVYRASTAQQPRDSLSSTLTHPGEEGFRRHPGAEQQHC
jgi:hypothetical protein